MKEQIKNFDNQQEFTIKSVEKITDEKIEKKRGMFDRAICSAMLAFGGTIYGFSTCAIGYVLQQETSFNFVSVMLGLAFFANTIHALGNFERSLEIFRGDEINPTGFSRLIYPAKEKEQEKEKKLTK